MPAYPAAVFLCGDARRPEGAEDLADQFRTRALVAAALTGLAGIVVLFVLRSDAPLLFDGLTGRAAPVGALSVVAGVGALVLLATRRYAPGSRPRWPSPRSSPAGRSRSTRTCCCPR